MTGGIPTPNFGAPQGEGVAAGAAARLRGSRARIDIWPPGQHQRPGLFGRERPHSRTATMRTHPRTLRRPDDLIAAGLVPRARRAEIDAVAARYALALTADVAELIDPADPHDAIARQFVPDPAELERAPEEMADPI